MSGSVPRAEFDDYAAEYDSALARGLSVSGEGKEYFAQGRAVWLAGRLRGLGIRPLRVMEFGCGNGSNSVFLRDSLGPQSVIGVDLSVHQISMAREKRSCPGAEFFTTAEYQPDGLRDLVFCNGVFHHISPPERGFAMDYIRRSLRPGGLLSLWENNPWNPGARLVMRRIPFDRDATPVTPREARALVEAGGFEVLRTDYLFIFPRFLRWLRPLERLATSVPLGAQYQVLCRAKGPP